MAAVGKEKWLSRRVVDRKLMVGTWRGLELGIDIILWFGDNEREKRLVGEDKWGSCLDYLAVEIQLVVAKTVFLVIWNWLLSNVGCLTCRGSHRT